MSMASTFRFRVDGTAFDGRLDGDVLTLGADLGGLPFSAEDAAGRKRWLSRIAGSDAREPDHHRLDENAHVRLESRTRVEGPMDASRLIEVLTVLALSVRHDAVADRKPAAAGTAARRFTAERAG
ncbi:hypothetical protein L2U69_00795 [Zavarzinia compransoris]|uniref:hypothetical protein n=1 Tax=Zavarzinia marina TaxID=2911065 RepID=UPI001F450C8A|nr:hypothetical protein [Zavarzinia marina]MCF4164180.1 hypothetical protein [Zavarzinia marina]